MRQRVLAPNPGSPTSSPQESAPGMVLDNECGIRIMGNTCAVADGCQDTPYPHVGHAARWVGQTLDTEEMLVRCLEIL